MTIFLKKLLQKILKGSNRIFRIKYILMIIDAQTKIYNPKVSITHKIENPYYNKTRCAWHYNETCFVADHEKRHFHCLYDIPSRQIRYKYYNNSKSCDIPENFHDLIMLHDRLGTDYVLPFVTHFRVATGETIGLFEIKNTVYGSSILKSKFLVEAFLTYVVFVCEGSYRLGGNSPVLNDMKFLYTKTHPILVDIHINNSLRRNQSKIEEVFSQKKWNTFLTKRCSKEIIHYMKLVHYKYFKKKKKLKSNCILAEKIHFNDITHEIFCKNKKTPLYKILQKYKEYAPNLLRNIDQILDSVTFDPVPTIG